MWVIHLRADHVQHRHAYLRRSIPVFGPFEAQPDSLTVRIARKVPLAAHRASCTPGNSTGRGLLQRHGELGAGSSSASLSVASLVGVVALLRVGMAWRMMMRSGR